MIFLLLLESCIFVFRSETLLTLKLENFACLRPSPVINIIILKKIVISKHISRHSDYYNLHTGTNDFNKAHTATLCFETIKNKDVKMLGV